MKECPKCGYKNDNNANFCSNCSNKLEKVTRPLKKGASKKIIVTIVLLAIIVTVSLSAIIFFNKGISNKPKQNVAKISTSKKVKNTASISSKQAEKTKKSNNSNEKLSITDLTPAQTAAAIIYYGTQDTDLNKQSEGWVNLYTNSEKLRVYLTKKVVSNLEKPGQDVRYAVIDEKMYEGSSETAVKDNYYAPSYTIDVDNTINYYSPKRLDTSIEKISATKSVNLENIIKYINQHGDVDKINSLAKLVSIQDKRTESDESNTVTVEAVNNDKILLYKALIFYGIKNFDGWQNLDMTVPLVVMEDRHPIIGITIDQAGGGFLLYDMYTRPEQNPFERYAFGHTSLDPNDPDFNPSTRIHDDGVNSPITDVGQVVDFVNQNGGRSVLDTMNVRISN